LDYVSSEQTFFISNVNPIISRTTNTQIREHFEIFIVVGELFPRTVSLAYVYYDFRSNSRHKVTQTYLFNYLPFMRINLEMFYLKDSILGIPFIVELYGHIMRIVTRD
jgi:hypothetical protein